jgi:D-3-phosphoglycerate dehydrogenase / 2-oxoglutarate reductase
MSKKVAIGPSSFAAKDETPLHMLQAAGIEVRPNPYGRKLTQDEIIVQLEGMDGLIAGLEPLNRAVLSSAPDLKAIARVGIGMDNVDFEAAADLGIKVSNTPDGPTRAVAELTTAAMLCLCRQILRMNQAIHDGQWNKEIILGLFETPVLFIGYGRIGRAVADCLRPFGPQILVFDPYLNADEDIGDAVRVDLEQGLRKARVITMHAGGNNRILGQAEFEKMLPGVLLLNSARAGLVDEQALISALEKGIVGGAWFDVFWREPYQGRLQEFSNVLMTPHVGTYTEQCRLGMESEAVSNLLRDLEITK